MGASMTDRGALAPHAAGGVIEGDVGVQDRDLGHGIPMVGAGLEGRAEFPGREPADDERRAPDAVDRLDAGDLDPIGERLLRHQPAEVGPVGSAGIAGEWTRPILSGPSRGAAAAHDRAEGVGSSPSPFGWSRRGGGGLRAIPTR